MTMRRDAAIRPSRPLTARSRAIPGTWTARSLLCGGFWLASAAAVPSRGAVEHPKDPPGRPIVVVTLGGALQEAQQKLFFGPFTAATRIAIHAGSWDGTLAMLQNRARAGVDPGDRDLILMDDISVRIACRQGLLLPLEMAAAAGPSRPEDPDAASRCGHEALRTTLVLAWDESRIDTAPSWSDFWDVARRPGKRGLARDPRGTLEIALLADGVAPNDIYRTLGTPDGLDRAFRKLDQLKPYIVWWDMPAQAAHAIESGAVLMTSAPDGEVASADLIGHRDFGIQWRQSISMMLSWAVPGRPQPIGDSGGSGSGGQDAADRSAHVRQLLDFMDDPVRQAAFTGLYSGAGVVQGTPSPDQAPPADGSAAPQHRRDALRQDEAFWVAHLEAIRARFDAWLGN